MRLAPVVSDMPFYQLFRELEREGPGEPADVAWAVAQAGLNRDAALCDVACGSGADIAALLAACPEGHVVALDKQAHFVDEARVRIGDDPRVDLRVADMADIGGLYDFIWCAGAVYFLGVSEALKLWKPALTPNGTIAFSEPCWWGETPSPRAREQWAGYGAMSDEAGIANRVRAAGYETLGTRRLSAQAWERYYASLKARIDLLRGGADRELTVVLDESAAEIAVWRAHGDEFGYLLSVVRPL